MRDDICLVLPGIQLHPLQNKPPAGLAEAAAQLYRIQRSLRIDLTKRVGIWLPSDADYERLCDAVQLSDAALVSKVITTSIKRSTVSLSDHFSEPPVLPPVRTSCFKRGKHCFSRSTSCRTKSSAPARLNPR